jgi:hypothetical protein
LSIEFGIVTLACNICGRTVRIWKTGTETDKLETEPSQYILYFENRNKRKEERTAHEGRLAIAFESAESSALDTGKIANKQATSPRMGFIAVS